MSRNRFRTLLITVAPLLAAAPLLGQTAERVSLTGPRVAIWNIAGKITLGPSSGRSVEVSVTRTGADGTKLGIVHGPLGGRETLRVIFPGDEIVYRDRTRMGGRWSTELDVRRQLSRPGP